MRPSMMDERRYSSTRERRVAGFSKIALLGLGMAVSEDPRGTIAGRAEQRNQAAAAM